VDTTTERERGRERRERGRRDRGKRASIAGVFGGGEEGGEGGRLAIWGEEIEEVAASDFYFGGGSGVGGV
jgi:hypothetical protein